MTIEFITEGVYMNNIYIGLFCLVISIFIFFCSAREGPNALGYKSPQLKTHKSIWLWTNKCFGFFTLIGSCIYLLLSIILLLIKNEEYLSVLNKYGLFYILFSFIITEIYALTKKIIDNKNK